MSEDNSEEKPYVERKNPPKLAVDITEEQHHRLGELLEWGQKKPVFRIIIDDLIHLLEGDDGTAEDVDAVIGAIKSRNLKLLDILRPKSAQSLRTGEDHGND